MAKIFGSIGKKTKALKYFMDHILLVLEASLEFTGHYLSKQGLCGRFSVEHLSVL